MAGLSLRGIEKGFGEQAVLRRIDLDVRDGEFLTIVGPSGCGKSTLLRVIAGLERQQAGEVCIGDQGVDELLPSERDVAMVFQNYALYPHLSVEQNIAAPLRYRRMSAAQRLPGLGRLLPGARDARRAIDEAVRDTARLLDIEHLLARRPSQLSGGQRQRVALGRAIVRRPRLFLMDEPLSNLDATLRTAMRAELAQLHRRVGATFVYVTHDQVEAMTMSDRVAVMFDGRFEQVDTPERIYAAPATLGVAGFIGSPRINRVPAHARSGVVDLGEGRPRLAVGSASDGPVQACFRPESAVLARRAATWAGTVTFVEDMGADLHVHVSVPGAADAVIVRTSRGASTGLAIGAEVPVGVEPHALLLFGPDGRRLTCSEEATRVG